MSALREAALSVVRRLQQAGHDACFAGGSVRDQLLGRESKDIDVATSALPEQVQQLFPRHTGLEGKCFGVIRVLVDDFVFEVATFRIDDDYVDGRRPKSVRFTTAEEDARRRDFTVNGLFYDPVRDRLIDHVGGQADLAAKKIRAIGDPEARFREDKLRLLRGIRFAVNLGFAIEESTWQAIIRLAPEIAQISPERIRDELDKIWTGPDPARGLDLLDQSGLLAAILPEIHALHGVEQPPQWHPEGDVFRHTRLMLAQLRNSPLVLALSVLFHDVGKKPTQKVDATGRIRFNEHETVGARMAESMMKRLRYSNEVIAAVIACVANHMTFKDVPEMRVATLKRLMARETFPIELELHRIDCTGSHGDLSHYDFLLKKQQEFGAEQIRPAPLLNGHDLMALGFPEGRLIGKILLAVEEAQLEGKIKSKTQAIQLAREYYKPDEKP
jgi:putative nucleotidyltransferase with HDIG domain